MSSTRAGRNSSAAICRLTDCYCRMKSRPQRVQTLLSLFQLSVWSRLTSDEKTNNKKHRGGKEKQHKCYACQMSGQLRFPYRSSPSSPEARLRAPVLNTGTYMMSQRATSWRLVLRHWKSVNNYWWNKQTNTHKTVRTSYGAGVISANPVYATTCVRAFLRVCPCYCQMDIQCWAGHTETVAYYYSQVIKKQP